VNTHQEPFPKDVIAKLDAHPDPDEVYKVQGNDYIKGCTVIETLNRVFGAGTWSTRVVLLEHLGTRQFQKNGKDGWQIGYRAIVELEVAGRVYSDVGFGESTGYQNPYKDHDLAGKSAVTGGIKRAARLLGHATGNLLYDSDIPLRDKTEKRPDEAAQEPAQGKENPPARARQEAGNRVSGQFEAVVAKFEEKGEWMGIFCKDGPTCVSNDEGVKIQIRQATPGSKFTLDWTQSDGGKNIITKAALIPAPPGDQAPMFDNPEPQPTGMADEDIPY
jgi:hypothetical protein